MPLRLRLLLIDDNPDDRALVIRELRGEYPDLKVKQVTESGRFARILERGNFDLVVADYHLRWTTGLAALRAVKARYPDSPLILFSATGGKAIAAEVLKAGLSGYVLKSATHFPRLPAIVRMALSEVRQRQGARAAEASYRDLFERVPLGVYHVTPAGQILDANAALVRLLGYPDRQALMRVNAADLYMNSGDCRRWSARIRREGVHDVEVPLRRRDGAGIWVRNSTWVVRDGRGSVLYYEGAVEDISVLKQAEEAPAPLAAMLELTPDLVAIVDPDGYTRYLNSAARKTLGIAKGEDSSKLRLLDFRPAWARELFLNEAIPAGIRSGAWSGESAFLSRDGREIPVSEVTIAHKTTRGSIDSFYTIARDISERKRFEAELVHVADHDPLTDLMSRRRFQEELARQLAQARRYGTYGALLFLDLDDFKYVNDSLGHQAGDELLTSLSHLLRVRLRDSDLLARLGGDEFAILLPHADREQAQTVSAQLLEAMRHHVIVVVGKSFGITASIGIALFPEHGATVEELLGHADIAMYQAKEKGRNRFHIYAPDRDLQSQMESRLKGERSIREALEKNLFRLHAQPIRDLRSNQTSQYELLLRMAGEGGQLLLPAAFLGIAERFGLIHAIDRWVLHQAIHLLARQPRPGRELCLSVNLSGKAFSDSELLPMIRDELSARSVNPANLVLEITETAAIADTSQAQKFVNTLKGMGCRFALDDFGVGFSSLYHLKHLPVDYLKIDGSFVHDLPHNPVDQHLVKAMVEVARALNKETIAEFVGDEQTVRLLRECGVDYAQGYYIGRPRTVW